MEKHGVSDLRGRTPRVFNRIRKPPGCSTVVAKTISQDQLAINNRARTITEPDEVAREN